ncbi:MAG: TetR/AcrR family transcriptional regulator [Myxococcota bacterium]
MIEATLRLLAREGPRGVTHRAVAREAGTSVRGTTYHFESIGDLMAQALRHYAETSVARFEALSAPLEALRDAEVATLAPPAPSLVDVAAHTLARTVLSDLEEREGLLAELELALEAGRKPALEEDYRRWQERLEWMLREYGAAFGSSDPGLDARLVLATLRGLELEALARPSEAPDEEDLARVFRRLLTGLFGGR